MNLKDISVIIPTFNALEFLKQTIECLERQQPDPTAFQVVVVDDASTDGAGNWLKEYSGVLNLEAIVLPQNRGRPAVRNIGADKATGKVLLFIDGDMVFQPGFVRGHADMHTCDNLVVISRLTYKKTTGSRGYTRYLQSRGVMKLSPGETIPGRFFLSGLSSLSKSLFIKAGGYDEQFTDYGEDIDFGIRLVSAGGKLVYIPDLAAEHLHVRSFEEVLSNAHDYGRLSVPKLIKKHPELYSDLRLAWGDSRGISGNFKKMLLSEPIFRVVKSIVGMLNNFAAPAALYKYVLFRSYYSGYQKAVTGIDSGASGKR